MTTGTNLLKTYHLRCNDKQQHQFTLLPKKKFVGYAVYALIAVVLLYLFVDPAAPPPAAVSPPPSSLSSSAARPPWIQKDDDDDELPAAASSPQLSTTTTMSSSPLPSYQQGRRRCDYSDGEWVPDARPPAYDGATCAAIKDDGRSCTANGRADTGYVHWRWQPRGCHLPDFSAAAFLRWLRSRHMAFVGDSLARNQAESLVCLLSAASSPELVHRSADGRFRRWVFRGAGGEHDASVSIFWSPFLVKGVEKSERDGVRYNQVFLDAFDERWMSELAAVDALVLSAGHWFRIPTVYYHDAGGGGRVVGCHACDAAAAINGTAAAVPDMSFFSAFRDAVRRTLAEVARRHSDSDAGKTKTKLVAMTTFSPSHFDGQWNEGAPCKKRDDKTTAEPLGYTETEMRKIVVEEVEQAAAAAAASSSKMRFAAVDVTALANLRPDGHPGPYMRKNPFAAAGNNNSSTPVQHDCLHWCMPGPVDTFNQILLQTMLRR